MNETHYGSERDIMVHVRESLSLMSNSERTVAQFILDNPSEVIYLSAREIAEKCGVSDATVVRACQHLGFSGLQEFRLMLAPHAMQKDFKESMHLGEGIGEEEKVALAVKSAIEKDARAVSDTLHALSIPDLCEIARRLSTARIVHFYGAGTSNLVCQDAAIKFTRIGLIVQSFPDLHNALAAAALLTERDVAVAISHSGNTQDVARALRIAANCGAYTAVITNNKNSRLAAISDTVLLTSSNEIALHSVAITSRIAQLAVIDGLFVAVVAHRYERSEECVKKIAKSLLVTENT